MSKIDEGTCERIVGQVLARCTVPPPPLVHEAPPPSFDGLATSIAVGSAAIMVVTLVVIVLGIVVAVRWGQNVVAEAKEEARKEVSRVTPAHVKAYLDEKVPGMVTDIVADTVGGGSASEQAETLAGDAE